MIRVSAEAGGRSQKSPVLGRASLTGPARSPDHPFARQGQDVVADSPSRGRRNGLCKRFRVLLLEEGDMEPGRQKQ